jgi:hypothetical protein
MTTFITAISQGVTTVTDVLALFTKEPTVYFTALAFVSAALGVSRKLIPMKKR